MNHGHLQVGYHGCDITVRDGLVSGTLIPEPGNNQYDWLGPGFYLFEGDADRALAFAEAAASEPCRRFTARPIATPAVVGCIYQLQRCLDMTTKAGRHEFENAYLSVQATSFLGDRLLPINSPASDLDEDVLLRGLDRTIFRFIHQSVLRRFGFEYFQAVRGAFRQGAEIAPSSGFHRDSHIQIALRDLGCIKGWFLPPGMRQLSERELSDAKVALSAMRAANPKARRR